MYVCIIFVIKSAALIFPVFNSVDDVTSETQNQLEHQTAVYSSASKVQGSALQDILRHFSQDQKPHLNKSSCDKLKFQDIL